LNKRIEKQQIVKKSVDFLESILMLNIKNFTWDNIQRTNEVVV